MTRILFLALFILVAALPTTPRAFAQGDVFSSDDGPSAKQACLQGCNMKTLPSCRARDYAACRKDTTECRNKCYGERPGDVFTRDERTDPADVAYIRSCDADCVQKFGACEGGVSCNFELETCVHQCRCDVAPDECGPVPQRTAPADEPTVAEGSSGGAKGLVRKECQDAAAKGIFRKDCEELRKKDCADTAAKGIHRADCEDAQADAVTCEEAIGLDPEVSVAQLTGALDQCLAQEAALPWYTSPEMVVSRGAAAFHQEGTRTVTYDPAVLEPMSLYERSFWLADAFGAYVMDLEALRLGTVRSPGERSKYTHQIAGFLAHCLSKHRLFPVQQTLCPDARDAHREFLASASRALSRTGPSEAASVAHAEWDHGWHGYGAGLPGALRHDPTWDVIQAAQSVLGRLGYDPGPADGFMGPRTAAAVMAFERDHGLEPTGVLYERVLGLLAEESKRPPAP